MSAIRVFIALLLILSMEHAPQSYTISPLCRKGVVKVKCDLSECRKAGWPLRPTGDSRTYLDNFHLQLMKGSKIVNKSESVRNVTFVVGFVNLNGERTIRFECIFKSNRTQICRQSTAIDMESLPGPVQDISMLVAKSDNISKMIVVKFNESERNSHETATTALVTVSKYPIPTRKCSDTTTAGHSLQETRPCSKTGNTFVCSNLLEGAVYSFGIFAATAMVQNHVGTCYSPAFCKELTLFDVYGGLENVKVNFEAVHSNPRLIVSWELPKKLELVVINIIFSIKYCRDKCLYQNESRSLLNIYDNVFSAKIDKRVTYNAMYSIQICYIVSDIWSSSISPWTKPVSIKVPSRIPSMSPRVIKCENTDEELTILWKNENVEFYLLRIEVSGRTDSYLKVLRKDCRHNHCTFSLQISSLKKTYGIRVLPCSDSGCNNKSVSTCYFKARHSIGKSTDSKQTWSTGDILVIVLPFVGMLFVIIAFVLLIKIRKWWKSSNSQYQFPTVGPRLTLDSASSELSSDHSDQCYHEYEKI